ncbi:hypothetical protein H5410_063742, partial [Solanum commersonii]
SSSIYGYYDKQSYPKTVSWNMSRDCCLWEGVKCDETSGQCGWKRVIFDSIVPATEVTFNHMPPRLITFTPSHRHQSRLIFHELSLDKIHDRSNHKHSMRDLPKKSYPKTLSWNMIRDYCLWDGVKCDKTSGQVIELDISCS